MRQLLEMVEIRESPKEPGEYLKIGPMKKPFLDKWFSAGHWASAETGYTHYMRPLNMDFVEKYIRTHISRGFDAGAKYGFAKGAHGRAGSNLSLYDYTDSVMKIIMRNNSLDNYSEF